MDDVEMSWIDLFFQGSIDLLLFMKEEVTVKIIETLGNRDVVIRHGIAFTSFTDRTKDLVVSKDIKVFDHRLMKDGAHIITVDV